MLGEWTSRVRALIESVMAELGYGGIFLAAVVEVVFPPLPSDLLVPAAGVAAAGGVLRPEGVILAATAGTVVGALILYAFGRRGEPGVRRAVRRYGRWLGIREAEVDRALLLFRRYGAPILLVAHLIPGLRSGIAIPAGMSGMPLIPFGGLTALGAALRATLQTAAGLFLAWHLDVWISTLSLPGVIIIGGFAAVALGWTLVRRKRGHRPPHP
jgi:membrane protein DedA with SNARE-associated domain